LSVQDGVANRPWCLMRWKPFGKTWARPLDPVVLVAKRDAGAVGGDEPAVGDGDPFEPDVRIARIRLSDKSSRLRPRHVVPKPAQTYEPKVPVKVREWIGPALASPGFVLDAHLLFA
jgi:hypothetical protein